MISGITVKARAATMEEAEREIDIVLNHARLAGYLEGVVPQSSSTTDNHFGRVPGLDRWSDYRAKDDRRLEYEGRVVVTFDPEDEPTGGMLQFGYKVESAGEPWGAGEEGLDVTGEVIVLRRQCPVTRFDHASELIVDLDRGPGKATAEELAAFSELALAEEVQEIAFGPAKSRPGYEIDLAYLVPASGSSGNNSAATAMALGGRRTVYGETFRAAIDRAVEVLEEARRDMGSGTVVVSGR